MCKSRLQLLNNFLPSLRRYEALSQEQDFGADFYDVKGLLARDLDAVQEALDDVGVGALRGPVGGNRWENVRVVANLFNPLAWPKAPQAIDQVERGIGIYQRHMRRAFWQLFNPFAWVGEIAVFAVTQLVFQPIAPLFRKEAGDIAKSRLGKAILDTVRVVGQLGSLLATVVKLLDLARRI
jgi:hypothetical protein